MPVPQACQPIADQITALEAQEQQLRAQLPALVGARAWTALAKLGQLRQQLEQAHAALDECVRANSAALQATLGVIDVGPAGPAPARIATLWEVAPAGSTQRETATITGDAFSFTGPLPATFGLTVSTTGDPTILGPDFRSASLTAASLPADGAVRVEFVLGPLVRFEQADLARLAAVFTPTPSHVSAGAVDADLSVTAVEATLTDGGIVARASGQVEIRALGMVDRGPFSASGTLRVVPTAAPGVLDLVDLVTVADIQVQLPGIVGAFVDTILPLIRGMLSNLLIDQLRAVLRAQLPAAIDDAFVLAGLPPDVVVSVRRLSITPAAIEFQPALGALGTTLSMFTPPAIPPP